ncbi:MAG: GSCFA domain-containing protein [Bacteroidota bacterium]
MELITQIPIGKTQNPINYKSRILIMGSCFSEHMGCKLAYYKFQVLQNPFGILFHPRAIENMTLRAATQNRYTEDAVFEHNGLWHCFDVHSSMSDSSRQGLLQKLNDQLEVTRETLTQATHLIFTLGTAWGYRHIQKNIPVANCYKLPQKNFSKHLYSIPAIGASLRTTVETIRSINSDAELLFTISPVRHLKDGFVENQRSKAHLIAAVHDIVKNDKGYKGISYFPSYELMMDELRDYRFYAEDMVHPTKTAIDYIWERFRETWISEEAYSVMRQVDVVQKGLAHRPFRRASKQYLDFRAALEEKMAVLQNKYPFMEFE